GSPDLYGRGRDRERSLISSHQSAGSTSTDRQEAIRASPARFSAELLRFRSNVGGGEQDESMTTAAEKAELLRSLHVPGDPLILVNVWDAASARAVASAEGVRAIAT